MDIHKKSWSIHLRTDLCDHKGFTMPPDAEKLTDYIVSHFNDHQVTLTYEVACCGFSAATYFLNLGRQVKVVNPNDVPSTDKQFYQKTDKLDSRNLCKQLQHDQLKGIYIPTEPEEQLRSLLRQRNQVVKQLRVVKSQIKGLLLFHGITVPLEFANPNWSKSFILWLNNIQWTRTTGGACFRSKLRILAVLKSEYLQTSNEIRAYCFPKVDFEIPIAKNPAFLLDNAKIRKSFEERYRSTASLYYQGQPSFTEVMERIKHDIDRL